MHCQLYRKGYCYLALLGSGRDTFEVVWSCFVGVEAPEVLGIREDLQAPAGFGVLVPAWPHSPVPTMTSMSHQLPREAKPTCISAKLPGVDTCLLEVRGQGSHKLQKEEVAGWQGCPLAQLNNL